MVKFTVNYNVAYVLVAFVLNAVDENWYYDNGLVYWGFTCMVLNPVTHCWVQMEQTPLRCMQWVAAKRARTQAELNRCFRPPDVNFGEAYAKVMKTIMIAMFFGPAFPLAYPITFAAILALRYAWRYALLRVYAHAPMLNDALDHSIRDILRAQLFGGIMMTSYYIYNQQDSDAESRSWQYLLWALPLWGIGAVVPVLRRAYGVLTYDKPFYHYQHESQLPEEPFPDKEERERREGRFLTKGSWTYSTPTPTSLWGGPGGRADANEDVELRSTVINFRESKTAQEHAGRATGMGLRASRAQPMVNPTEVKVEVN